MNDNYQIKYDTLIFSDMRTGEIKHNIKNVFDLVDKISTIVESPNNDTINIIEFYRINHPDAYKNMKKHYSPEHTLKNVDKLTQKLKDCHHKMQAV